MIITDRAVIHAPVDVVWDVTTDIDGLPDATPTVTKAEPDWLEPHVKLASLYFRLHREAEARREEEIVEKLRSEHREKAVPLPEMR